jgi:hypothetical protein
MSHGALSWDLWAGGILAPRLPLSRFMCKWQGPVEIREYFHTFLHSFTHLLFWMTKGHSVKFRLK